MKRWEERKKERRTVVVHVRHKDPRVLFDGLSEHPFSNPPRGRDRFEKVFNFAFEAGLDRSACVVGSFVFL